MSCRITAMLSVVLRGGIQAYRLTLSPLLGPSCRFAPSCSAYALEAIQRHGPWAGSRMAAARILRCHPFHPGGFDPVPVGLSNHPGGESAHQIERRARVIAPAGAEG